MHETSNRRQTVRRAAFAALAIVLAGVLVLILSRLNLGRIAHALISASPGWVLLAFLLMSLSMLLRSISWDQILRAALPHTPIAWLTVARATMIGVMTSAVIPGRLGEPTRIYVLTRRLGGTTLGGSTTRTLAVVTGTVLSQTLINLLALAILAAVTFTSVPLLHGHASALDAVLAVPILLALLVFGGPMLLRLAQRAPSLRIRGSAYAFAGLLRLARRGLVVFTSPRHGFPAVSAQLFAWALQWMACYLVILALGLQHQATPVTAAAILLAINVSAVLPATPSNVGVFQAACLVVLAAYGVGAGPALAYGIILQAIEVLTALVLGVPALLGEGMSWQDIRRGSAESTTSTEEVLDLPADSSEPPD